MTRLLLIFGIAITTVAMTAAWADPTVLAMPDSKSFLLIGLGLALIGLIGTKGSAGGDKPQ